MSQPDRFDIVVPLHEISGWRRALAVDRGGVAPRAVVLSYPPSTLTDDPTRLVELMRDAEAAALVHHPNAVPALGLETAGDLLVAVEAYRRGVSLRALLAVARRLPPELAARVAVDACAALAAVHSVDPGDGHPLAHGGVAAERLLVADDGATLVCGTGIAGGGGQAEDVRGVAEVLRECLLGDPSAAPSEHAGASEIPPQLLEVVRRALGDAPGGAYADVEALSGAILEAIRPAPPEAMAAYLEAILPAGEGERGELLRLVANALSRAARPAGAEGAARVTTSAAEVAVTAPAAAVGEQDVLGEEDVSETASAAEDVLLPSAPEPGSKGVPADGLAPASGDPQRPSAPEPGTMAIPSSGPAPAGTPAAGSPTAAVAAVAAPPAVLANPAASPLLAHASGSAPAPAQPRPAVTVPPAAPAASSEPLAAPPAPQPAAPRSARSRMVLAVAVAMAILGFGGGLLVARSGRPPSPMPSPASGSAPVTAAPAPAPGTPVAPAPAAVPSPPPAAAVTPAPEARAVPPPAAAQPPSAGAGAPSIAVSAEPPGEVYVDGKRVGRSPLTVPVPRGDHEVRLRSMYEGVDVRRRVVVHGADTPVRFALRRGSLKVTAPQDAEVYVDGKRVGRGDVKVDLWEGNHYVEARLGQARVHEKFTLGPGETWTYDVTPTP